MLIDFFFRKLTSNFLLICVGAHATGSATVTGSTASKTTYPIALVQKISCKNVELSRYAEIESLGIIGRS